MTDTALHGRSLPSNVADLVEALDRRARQAGSDGAATVLRGLLGSVSEALETIDRRLDRLDGRLAPTTGHDPAEDVADRVTAMLATFDERLARFEQALAAAEERRSVPAGDAPRPEEVMRLALDAVADRLDAIEQTIVEHARPEPPPAPPAPTLEVEPIVEAIVDATVGRLSGRLDAVAASAGQVPPAVTAEVARLVTSLDERVAAVDGRVAAVDGRVGAIDERLANLPAPPTPLAAAEVTEAASAAIDPVRERLARIELAVAERWAPPDLASAVRPLDERLAGIEARLAMPQPDHSADVTAAVEEVGSSMADRLSALEHLVRSMEPPDPAVALRASLAPVVERLDGLDAALRSFGGDGTGATIDAIRSTVDDAIASLAAQPATARAGSLDEDIAAEILARVDELADAMLRGGDTARVVTLIEERMAAVLRAVADRGDASRAAIDELADQLDRDERAIDELARSVRDAARDIASVPAATAEVAAQRVASRLQPIGDRLDHIDERAARLETSLGALRPDHDPAAAWQADMGSLDRALSAVAADVREMRLAADERRGDRDLDAAVSRVTDTLRRESELLTQRVAALAAGVEATRVLLNQHIEDTDRALGRRGGEITLG